MSNTRAITLGASKYGYHQVGEVLVVNNVPCRVVIDRTEDGKGCVLNANGVCPHSCEELCRPDQRTDHKCIKYWPLKPIMIEDGIRV